MILLINIILRGIEKSLHFKKGSCVCYYAVYPVSMLSLLRQNLVSLFLSFLLMVNLIQYKCYRNMFPFISFVSLNIFSSHVNVPFWRERVLFWQPHKLIDIVYSRSGKYKNNIKIILVCGTQHVTVWHFCDI